ncbi:hypothetical protein SAMN02745166_01275 [Prosthecobacter debontii]|uniref:Pycsar effector protein domain-containing protein n=1 Tax=Prosthecobacter debontii TaxID=48467 RepID=A0A1T4XBG2_9BACT|nr:Pycsar system effector family protein [Prosthecobacter debontii]SKA86281.1 hypothetical protein SAMN02745166_01275 [Prosthecobacter debontii]
MADVSAPPAPVHSSAPAPVTSLTSVSSTAVDLTRLIYMLYQDVEAQINRADLKAQITLSTSAILAAMVANLGLGLASPHLTDWRLTEWCVLVVYGAFLLSITMAIGHALLAAFPRSLGKSHAPNPNPNLYFTADIVSLEAETYVRLFSDQLNSDVRDKVLKQIHAKARVLEMKIAHIRTGLRFLSLAMMLWLLARIVLVIGYARLPAHG